MTVLGSYKFIGSRDGLLAGGLGIEVRSIGDADGDGVIDFVLTSRALSLVGSVGGAEAPGRLFFISGADIDQIDGADGSPDGEIDIDQIVSGNGSFEIANDIGPAGGTFNFGSSVDTAGDIDGDGQTDLIIGAPGDTGGAGVGGEAYVVTLADLQASAANSSDGIANVTDIIGSGSGSSYRFTGDSGGDAVGTSVTSVEDIDGDGRKEYLIGAPGAGLDGEAYLIMSGDLETLDLANGLNDQTIYLEDVSSLAAAGTINSYRFHSTSNSGDEVGFEVVGFGDFDGDGVGDFVISAPGDDAAGTDSGAVYVISGADLADLDGLDGSEDGSVDLSEFDGSANNPITSYAIIGQSDEDRIGLVVSTAPDSDSPGDFDIGFISDGAQDPVTGETFGAVYLLNSSELALADVSGGRRQDGVIDLDTASADLVFVGSSVEVPLNGDLAVGDVGGDGEADILVSSYVPDGVTVEPGSDTTEGGTVYYIDSSDYADAIATTGQGPNVIDVEAAVDLQRDSYKFIATNSNTGRNISVDILGDVDGDGDTEILIGVPGTLEDGGRLSNGASYVISESNFSFLDALDGTKDNVIDLALAPAAPCFTRGTLIVTADGMSPVEEIRVGDRILTYDNGMQKVRWHGKRRFSSYEMVFVTNHLMPILIKKGSLGHGTPTCDLRVSPQHRVLFSGSEAELLFGDSEVLVPAKFLVGLDGIEIDRVPGPVEYHHIMLDRHEILFSNGALTESFYPGTEALSAFDAAVLSELYEIFPELEREGETYGARARRSLKQHEAQALVSHYVGSVGESPKTPKYRII